jgi:branched-chain amino acid transport system substrate-binding protein
MKKRPALIITAVAAAAALALTACSSSGGGNSGGTSSTGGSAPAGGTSSTGGAGSSTATQSKGTIKVALMIPIASNPTPINIYTDPAQMAVNEINAAGGIDGKMLSLSNYDAGFDTQGAITAMQKAIADKVGLVIGLPIADQVLAVRPLLDKAKIPLLYLGGGFAAGYTPNSTKGSSEWAFRVGPPSELTVNAGVQYAIKNLKAPNIGLMLRDDESKDTSTTQADKGAATAGGKVTVSRTIPLNSTNVTTQIIAEKNVNAIFTTDYVPGIVAVLKAVKQQGLNIPVMVGQTGMTVYLQKSAPADEVTNMYSAAPCNMFDPYSAASSAWVTKFKSMYNFMPDPNSSTAYDAFYLFKTALEAANGQTGQPLLTALENVKMNGVCEPYATDAQHFMSDTESVISFSGATPKTVATYNFSGSN